MSPLSLLRLEIGTEVPTRKLMRVIVLSAFDLLVCVCARALARRVCATGRARGIAATTDDDRLYANSAAISLRCD